MPKEPGPTSEMPALVSEWASYIEQNGASRFIGPVRGSWAINGRPLRECPDFGTENTGTKFLLSRNFIDPKHFWNSQISFTWLNEFARNYDDKLDFLCVGPMIEKGQSMRAGKVISATDRPNETLYSLDIIFYGPSREEQSRGSNLLQAKILLPKTKALQFLAQARQKPALARMILDSLYEGVSSPQIKYATKGVCIIAQAEEKVLSPDHLWDELGKLHKEYYQYPQISLQTSPKTL
ncbi:hypothetical protein A2160_03755 [Candidatus Beckwithbacteria bacterium RBG_13_42_9]|uniref:Uncharacterized protein n=1 Tax=Candidatus Beckwithbacteria bacterium RBG_13_42_9 TaxID=1797457 RepID=A0A1F5E8T0_9BACT|nr:MAG: hypothetical protein A2160_03755 [Candidatus Beckwithbacteria bacterium RBG_13_42_9]